MRRPGGGTLNGRNTYKKMVEKLDNVSELDERLIDRFFKKRGDSTQYLNRNGKAIRLSNRNYKVRIISDEALQRECTPREYECFRILYNDEKKLLKQIGGSLYRQLKLELSKNSDEVSYYNSEFISEAFTNENLWSTVSFSLKERIAGILKREVESTSVLRFEYCSRKSNGVEGLRRLLPYGLVMQSTYYEVKDLTPEQLMELTTPFGLTRIITSKV